MVQLTEVSSGLFSSETRSCCPLCFEMLTLQISNSLAGSLHQLPDSIYSIYSIYSRLSTGHVMDSCQGRNGFYCFLLFFFLFLWFYLSKLLSIFQTGKKALDCFFLYGVLSGKTACNKFMHRDQSFHSKTQSFFPFFFHFSLCVWAFLLSKQRL